MISFPRDIEAAWPAESTKRGIILTSSVTVSPFSPASSMLMGSTLKSSVAILVGETGADVDSLTSLIALWVVVGLTLHIVGALAIDFVVETTTGCSDKSAEAVRTEGDEGEEDEADDVAVMAVAAPDTVGGVGVRVLTPDVSEAGETTRRDFRPPFCCIKEAEVRDGVD